jgi:hypothetical protein
MPQAPALAVAASEASSPVVAHEPHDDRGADRGFEGFERVGEAPRFAPPDRPPVVSAPDPVDDSDLTVPNVVARPVPPPAPVAFEPPAAPVVPTPSAPPAARDDGSD